MRFDSFILVYFVYFVYFCIIFNNYNGVILYMFCKYRDIFGKVGEGVHSYRIFNIAIVDVVFTILAAYIIHLFNPKYGFIFVLVVLFITGIILHHLFCVRTTVDKLIFG